MVGQGKTWPFLMAAKKKTPAKKGRPAKKASAATVRKKDPADTQFKPGNRIWQLRKSHHCRPLIFETPDALWDAACKYFDWATDNPLLEQKTFCSQGEIITAAIPKARAFTLSGLSLFIGIGRNTFDLYRKRDDFADVVHAIEDVIWSQKFEHAAADQMNAMIVARELGLKESNSHEHTGKDGGPIESADVTDFEKARRIAFYLAQAVNKKAE